MKRLPKKFFLVLIDLFPQQIIELASIIKIVIVIIECIKVLFFIELLINNRGINIYQLGEGTQEFIAVDINASGAFLSFRYWLGFLVLSIHYWWSMELNYSFYRIITTIYQNKLPVMIFIPSDVSFQLSINVYRYINYQCILMSYILFHECVQWSTGMLVFNEVMSPIWI